MSIFDESDLSSRRSFCALAGRAASLAAAGVLLNACGGSPTSPGGDAPQLSSLSGTVSGRTVSVPIANGSALATVGGAALITSSLGSFLAFRTSDTALTVLTANCTHAACTVSGFQNAQYVCPCHGSRYTTTGSVANGPAAAPLVQFASTFANGTLTFNA
jgi:cytochrome b6-f complex iron-sulfur subunit